MEKERYRMDVVDEWPDGHEYTFSVQCWSHDVAVGMMELFVQSLDKLDKAAAPPVIRVYLLEDGKVIDRRIWRVEG